jgi:hypothetical protein
MIFVLMWTNFAVVIEEIQEDDKPAGGEGQKGSNKKQTSEDGDNSRLQVAVRTPTAGSLESEDEDGFPVSDSKSSKGSSKKETKTNEDRKRKSGDITEPSGYMLVHYFALANLFNHDVVTCVILPVFLGM